MPMARAEQDVDSLFSEHINGIFASIGGNLTAFVTGDYSEVSEGEDDCEDDVSIVLAVEKAHKFAGGEREGLQSQTARSHPRRSMWARTILLVEVMKDRTKSPFVPTSEKLALNESEDGEESRALMVEYGAKLLLHQHRVYALTMFVVQDLIWLIRWDCAGAAVARAFDYNKEPRHLIKFLFRLAAAVRDDDPRCIGYDTSVSLASQAEIDVFDAYRKTLVEGSWHHTYASQVLDGADLYPIHKVTYPDIEGLAPEHIPADITSSLTGRGGKGYIAYDVDRRRLVFIKEYWRADHPTVHPEVEVYKRLRGAGVTKVATAIAGGCWLVAAGQEDNDTYLALYYSHKFNAAHHLGNGHYVGGREKIRHMKSATPPITLLDEGSNISLLLNGLYAIGRNHYSRIDVRQCRQKWGGLKATPRPAEASHGVEIVANYSDPELRSAVQALITADVEECRREEGIAGPGSRVSSAAAATAAPSKTPIQDFTTHAPMLALAHRVKGSPPAPKVPDRFANLVHYEPTRPKGQVGRKRTAPQDKTTSGRSSNRIRKKRRAEMETASASTTLEDGPA
ncbi:uncharacterized protein PHACADRAFT_188541 [Phanerochaete carnosa HHB-10118-sp]|uniref:Fungal-type protein kinase domain-containing protein n=1 Tax=Phanerochaete carnosa (strain HHB-10118-sp) TaxID=650164 RepID=K5VUG3_PHACS|nr:uncharacterized protein PHACADRAFT_188541 [Phanerochaete carnosa HHB-10118-sp]EKM50224.1 hypothetical protein PHACADRAFT_188541 [Phanerochaete carnosa HHB-10118-sp]